jgi:hypothetical protein
MTFMGEFMIKRIVTLIIAIVMIASGCVLIAQGQEINTNTHNIVITIKDDSLSVTENIIINNISGDTIDFSAQNGHSDFKIVYNETTITIEPFTNIYNVNITDFGITSNGVIEVSYSLEKTIEEFEKTILYNTSAMTINFDNKEIYSSKNLKTGSIINIALQKEIERQTITVETIPTWIYIIILVLLILLIIALMRSIRKPKTTMKKEPIGGSEELFTAKKAMLMEILKDIEKRHRGKQISDDTYHKLKSEFKQEAIETMKILDDMQSKK